jgi:hypothetical protein
MDGEIENTLSLSLLVCTVTRVTHRDYTHCGSTEHVITHISYTHIANTYCV